MAKPIITTIFKNEITYIFVFITTLTLKFNGKKYLKIESLQMSFIGVFHV